jgi:NADH-quinone oxidoreductase subunit F
MKEGITVETMVSPIKIYAKEGRLVGIECIRNRLGDPDASGRCRPVPVPGSEFTVSLNTLIVAIGERPDSECLGAMGLELAADGTLKADANTLRTNREGVFAGGDMVTGPYTVANAIAAGKKAADMIDRYLRGQELRKPPAIRLPQVFIEPAAGGDEPQEEAARAEPATIPVEARRRSFAEVETTLSVEEATAEARRCLRCDLRFTQCKNGKQLACADAQGESA